MKQKSWGENMLLELKIQNFAIIDDLTIEFTDGLNVLTGETGSGKSIIIDALSTVLGGKASKDMVKKGRDYSFIEAVFQVNDMKLLEELDSLGFKNEELLIMSKTIYKDRPSITRINGRASTLNIAGEVSKKLIDIFAQEESQSLMDTRNQLILLDSFCGEDHMLKLEELNNINLKLNNYKDKLVLLKNQSENRDREIDILNYQLQEIDDANLTYYDEEELENDYKKFINMNSILEHLNNACEILNSSYEKSSAISLLDKVISEIVAISKYDDEFCEDLKELEDIKYRISDIYKNLKHNLDYKEVDEEKLFYLESRIDLVNSLKKKYGNTLTEIADFYNNSKIRLEELNNLFDTLFSIENKIKSLNEKGMSIAKEISKKRKEISKELELKLKKEMIDLNIKNADFKVIFEEQNLTKKGIDKIHFVIKTNLGMEYLDLSKTASGGEMSRIMLAFKSIISNHDSIETLIFDEIDTGISGYTANIVGKKIKELSENRQIIAISHLPQIVSLADSHFKIFKEEKNGETISSIKKLKREERVDEIARLIGGPIITNTTLKAANEMLRGEDNGN